MELVAIPGRSKKLILVNTFVRSGKLDDNLPGRLFARTTFCLDDFLSGRQSVVVKMVARVVAGGEESGEGGGRATGKWV